MAIHVGKTLRQISFRNKHESQRYAHGIINKLRRCRTNEARFYEYAGKALKVIACMFRPTVLERTKL